MSLFLFASFNAPDATVLSDYTPELGGSFVKHPSSPDAFTIQSNRAGKDANVGTAAYYASVAPQVRDYSIKGVIVDVGNVNRASGSRAGWTRPPTI